MFKKAKSANSLPFAVHFHMGAYFCMGAYKRDVIVVIKWVPIFIGCLFMWVLIIPILRYLCLHKPQELNKSYAIV